MTMLPFKLSIDPTFAQVLLTVRGEMAPPDLEGGRKVHNLAAGSDQAVAAARSFGDLSHAVFVPVEPPKSGAGELLIVDYWNSVPGLQAFFAQMPEPTKETRILRDREAVVWESTPGLPRISLPPPNGRNERWAGLVRGIVASRRGTEELLTETTRKAVNTARARGLLSREFFFRMSQPGEKPSLELIGLDIWYDADGMQKDYADPAMEKSLSALFTNPPETSVWQKPAGHWVEW